MDELIAAIVNRTRKHKDIARGASVRGAIAFKEVLQGFREMEDELTAGSIERAALITLAPRITTREGDYKSAEAIISEIVREVLYGVWRHKAEDESALPEKMEWLSPEEIRRGLQSLNQLSREQDMESAEKGKVVIVSDKDRQQGLLEQLESKGFLQKGEGDAYSFTKKAIEHLMKELEQKLMRGEITEDEYYREKGRLTEMLKAASLPPSQMSSEELSETVMEFMDAQDKQWEKKVSFERMYIYYHIKSTCEKKELSPQKRDYYGLKILIGELEKGGMIKVAAPEEGFILTGEALTTLLDYLVPKASKGKESWGRMNLGKVQIRERSLDIRKYSPGDVFRDISVRHTLKEIVKQKKRLGEVRMRDFRVFMRRHPKLQSDIVLCVDTSGSMGYRHKLTYARLAAAGLARAAIENGDRVGIITFDDFGKMVMPLSDKREALLDFLAGLGAGGNTNIGDGIQCATQLLLHQPSRNQKHIILITDGQPNTILEKVVRQLTSLKGKDSSEEYAVLETRKAAAKGIIVSVIHIADGQREGDEFVKNIIKTGKGQVKKVSCVDDLWAYGG